MGLIVLDSDWRFTYANAAAERMLSCAAADLIGKNHWEVYPATMGTVVETNYRRAMSERVSLAFENFYEPWQRWFDLRVYPSRDGGLSIYFQDATDRKKAEEALRRLNETLERQVIDRTAELQEKQARLRTIFETSYAYQGLLALDGTLLDANSTSLSGIGATLDDVVGLPFWETPWFTGTPGMAEMVRAGISAVARGETVRQEIHVNLPIGGWRWFDFQMRPVRDDQGAVVAIVPEAVEVTERRAAEEAVRHSQKMDAIGQLTGGVAHDFNNLLTIIRSSADLLRRRDLPAERFRRYVDAISDTADRAAKLTNQLLIFSRRHPVTREVFDIADRLRRISEMLQTVVGSHISLQLDIAEQPLAVEADANQFENVMVNLAANARDAMDGRGSLSITARSSPKLRCQRRIRDRRGPRHGLRHSGEPNRKNIRAVLHDKAGRPRYRPGPFSGLWLRAAIWRQSNGRQHGRRGHDDYPSPAAEFQAHSAEKRRSRCIHRVAGFVRASWSWRTTHRSVNSPRSFFLILAMRPCLRLMRKRRCNSLRRNRIVSISFLAMW